MDAFFVTAIDFVVSLFSDLGVQSIYIGCALFLGSILRGISGFGLSMMLIVVLTLFMPPAEAVTYILIWEILASIVHLPFVWRQVQWRTVAWLMLGVFIGTPLGVATLIFIPPATMTIAINLMVIFLCMLMLRGYKLDRNLTAKETTGTGFISGLINGASANGGPPVILLFFSSPSGVAVGRASIIAYFLFIDIWATSLYIYQGMTTLNTLFVGLAFSPLLVLGLSIGSKLYSKIPEDVFKRGAILALMLISLIGCLRAFFAS